MRHAIMMTSCAAALALMLVPSGTTAQEFRTAKERSSRKWFDEQRVDNCRVPVELRGTTPRPGCPGDDGQASADRAASARSR